MFSGCSCRQMSSHINPPPTSTGKPKLLQVDSGLCSPLQNCEGSQQGHLRYSRCSPPLLWSKICHQVLTSTTSRYYQRVPLQSDVFTHDKTHPILQLFTIGVHEDFSCNNCLLTGTSLHLKSWHQSWTSWWTPFVQSSLQSMWLGSADEWRLIPVSQPEIWMVAANVRRMGRNCIECENCPAFEASGVKAIVYW